MCLIVDANAAGELLARPSAVLRWLLGSKGSPRLVAAGRLRAELASLDQVRRLLVRLEQAGRLRSVPSTTLQHEESRLQIEGLCQSNDVHVLALGRASGARTLATFDNRLAADFKNPAIINKPRGRIYRKPKTQAHLLGHTSRSCGISN